MASRHGSRSYYLDALHRWGARLGTPRDHIRHIAPLYRRRLRADVERDNGALLGYWGRRVGREARHALSLAGSLAAFKQVASHTRSSIARYFRTDQAGHAFHVEPHGWLRLTEVQATKGLAAFLTERGSGHVLAFLRALAPEVAWPAQFSGSKALAEVPAGRGRIDLVLCGEHGGQIWGAAVEAKFDYHARYNPLPEYRVTAGKLGVVPTPGEEGARGVLRILGRRSDRPTTKRLNKNKDWRFVGWRAVLFRFERELADMADDDEFRRFRRTLWERAG